MSRGSWTGFNLVLTQPSHRVCDAGTTAFSRLSPFCSPCLLMPPLGAEHSAEDNSVVLCVELITLELCTFSISVKLALPFILSIKF